MPNTSQDHIRLRAYQIWEQEGYPYGREDVHWAQAEAEFSTPDRYTRDNAEDSDDLEQDPGIGYSRGTTDGDIEDMRGENTLEGDVLNDPEPTGAINPLGRGRTDK